MANIGMGTVILLGMGTVFVGLVCIVILISIMNLFFKNQKPKAEPKTANSAPASSGDERLDSETVAAVSAALAETMGKDVSAIRITSIKKVDQ
ncbi:MAG: hypothetical protein E7591_01845 [Ruminococcaceae bacterium]|nr:hypothetical protein [Oscillospiraceae bacterium]